MIDHYDHVIYYETLIVDILLIKKIGIIVKFYSNIANLYN